MKKPDQINRRQPQKIDFDDALPISAAKDKIIHAIQHHPVVIVSGETGSGKTTQIPKCCLLAGRGKRGMIGCTQPRRIAAINVAKRIAFELGEKIGRSVGYKIRFDDKTDPDACIKLMTDGILLAEAQADRNLKMYDTLIVDEAHERSLNIDFTLGLLRRLVKKRKDLKLVITSATIDTEKFSAAFGDAPVIEVSGRLFPVQTMYQPVINPEDEDESLEDQGYVEAAADAVRQILSASSSGDILVFMPTEQDIGETLELIRGEQRTGVTALPLFARLSAKEQAKIFSRQVGRKVIVSTNVAETSLTIPGIKYVVDTGLARIPSYSPRTRTTALPVSPISQSSANQRQGRCGRVENGICIRLYDETAFLARPFFTAPEILRSNLAEVILRMISLKLGDVDTFPFIDPPAPKSISDGFETLVELGAIRPERSSGKKKKGRKRYVLTPTGRLMARLPIDPKLSRILIEADRNGCLKEAVIITTCLAVSDPRQRPADKTQAADQQHAQFKDPGSDFITLLNIWNAYGKAEKELKSRSRLIKFCRERFLSFKRIREWKDIHHQILKILKENGIRGKKKVAPVPGTKGLKSKTFATGGPLYIAIHKSLLAGYLSHVAHKKENNIYNAAKGRQAMIFPGSGLFSEAGQWIVAAEYVQTSRLFARTVANIEPEWVEAAARPLCTRTYSDPVWEKKQGRVTAKEQVALFGLILVSGRKVAYGKINPDEAGDIFIREALIRGEIHQKFAFMEHNRGLAGELEALEDKTRKKDILVSEEEMFDFYHKKLPEPFSDIRSFSRFYKEKNNPDFLKMTLSDLQKNDVDEDEIAKYPDTLDMDSTRFTLEYHFKPGTRTDGVTIRVPKTDAGQVKKTQIERLVPGLFEEKITALIKALPKKYRVYLVPVSEKARLIAREMPEKDTPLFNQLSEFIHTRFNILVPANAFSDRDLPDHLKMRISIRDQKGREIKAGRDSAVLEEFRGGNKRPPDHTFRKAKAEFEKTGITQWDFGDLQTEIEIPSADHLSRKGYPGLCLEPADDGQGKKEKQIALRLFRNQKEAQTAHRRAVARMYQNCWPGEFKALRKDITANKKIREAAPYFCGPQTFQDLLFQRLVRHLFEKEIRTRIEFEAHAEKYVKTLYRHGQDFIQMAAVLGDAYKSCFDRLQKLSFTHQSKPKTSAILNSLFSDLKNLVPPDFPAIYDMTRIRHLHRYVRALEIRAQRAADAPVKDGKKAALLKTHTRHLENLMSSLSTQSTPEKTHAVESFYWMLEEYKISLFAQEVGTIEKISAKKLDQAVARISRMI